METQLPFPVIRVQSKSSWKDITTVKTSKKTDQKYIRHMIPAYTADGGQMMRQCTDEWKIKPMQKYLRQFKGEGVIQWMGISTDEAHRQKDSRLDWITLQYPLIEKRLSRSDCLRWMEENGYPTPPRSACVFCPYHSDQEWSRLKNEEPEEFAKAVVFDRELTNAANNTERLRSGLYLHVARKPLDKIQFRHQDQPNMFGNECTGMCGV